MNYPCHYRGQNPAVQCPVEYTSDDFELMTLGTGKIARSIIFCVTWYLVRIVRIGKNDKHVQDQKRNASDDMIHLIQT